MATDHTVQQGEHVSRIAAQYGVGLRTIWDHAKNADLAKKRKTPNILLPGDKLFVPDRQRKDESAATEKIHQYKLTDPVLKLRIAVFDFDNKAVANADCELEVEGTVHALKTDANGVIEHAIPVMAEYGRLRVPSLGIEIPVKIGHLHPLDEESGWKARLVNLGYWGRESDPLRLRYAIEEFQCDHGLTVTGEMNDATRTKVGEVHGC